MAGIRRHPQASIGGADDPGTIVAIDTDAASAHPGRGPLLGEEENPGMDGAGEDRPRCKVCGLAPQARGCTHDKCRDFVEKKTPALKRPFGRASVLTSSEKEKRKQETEAALAAKNLHDYVAGNLFRRRQWVDHHDRKVEWAEEESRRYTTILVQVRKLHETWTSEAVRKEAQRLLKFENGGHELRVSYVPKT
jgi:hypothetical protein